MADAAVIDVLAVDDNQNNLRSLEALMETMGAHLITAGSGDEALREVMRRDFSLILLDVRMPGLDGLETAAMIRARERSRHTPIIFLTGFDRDEEQVIRGYSLGAVDFLFKPIVPEILKAKVSVFIELYRSKEEVKRQAEMLREAEQREHEQKLAEEKARWEAKRLRDEIEAARRLSAERERQVVTLRSIGDAVVASDPEGYITLMNKAASTLTGWSETEAVGKQVDEVLELLDPRTRERRPFPDGRAPVPLEADSILVRRDRTERIVADCVALIVDSDGNAQGHVFVFRDVTAERRLEQEVQNAQRLEGIGLLAGGIAHDFNNMLAVLLATTSLARERIPQSSEAHQMLGDVDEIVERATALTRQLLTFARGGEPVRQPCAIERLVRDSVAFTLRGASTIADYHIAKDVYHAEIDAGQICQVLSNLVLNARDAMEHAGHLTVSVRNHEVSNESRGWLNPGSYVEISIADTGPGIQPRVLDRIFDPYFTTKPTGTGLGLATAYSIVKRHGGLLRAQSHPGDGATFYVYLPASPGFETVEAQTQVHRGASGEGRVLVMDDEQTLRDVVADCLVELGYRAETAPDGLTAVERYRGAMLEGDPFDVVILDLTVRGGMGGAEALAELKKLDPEVRAIASSGYSNDPVMARHREYGFVDILPKPYRFAMLARAMRGVIAPQSARSGDASPGRVAFVEQNPGAGDRL